MRRPDKRRCRQCHAQATHVEVQERQVAVLKRDGTTERHTEQVFVYWCDEHSGVSDTVS